MVTKFIILACVVKESHLQRVIVSKRHIHVDNHGTSFHVEDHLGTIRHPEKAPSGTGLSHGFHWREAYRNVSSYLSGQVISMVATQSLRPQEILPTVS